MDISGTTARDIPPTSGSKIDFMGKRKRNRRADREQTAPVGGDPFSGGFGALLQAKGLTQTQAETKAETKAPSTETLGQATDNPIADAQRWIIRISKKGRGGREATLLSPRGLAENTDLRPLAKRLRRELGCGAAVDAGHQ